MVHRVFASCTFRMCRDGDYSHGMSRHCMADSTPCAGAMHMLAPSHLSPPRRSAWARWVRPQRAARLWRRHWKSRWCGYANWRQEGSHRRTGGEFRRGHDQIHDAGRMHRTRRRFGGVGLRFVQLRRQHGVGGWWPRHFSDASHRCAAKRRARTPTRLCTGANGALTQIATQHVVPTPQLQALYA